MFAAEGDGVAVLCLPPPTDAEVAAVCAHVVRRTARVLAHRDASAGDAEPPDALALAQAELVQLPLPLSPGPTAPGPAPPAARTHGPLCAFTRRRRDDP